MKMQVTKVYKKMAKAVQEELKTYFRPEFLNRLDEIIVFQQLTQNDVRQIADIMLGQLCKRIQEQGYSLKIDDKVREKLAKDGFNPVYGARPLRRVIMSALEDRLANLLLADSEMLGSNVSVELDSNNEITITKKGGAPITNSEENEEIEETTPKVRSSRVDLKRNRRKVLLSLQEKNS